jgi:hypothetical protein
MCPINRPIVALDSAGPQHGRSHVFKERTGEIVARAPAGVESALDRLGEARTQGFHAAGYFSYELSYALEPKLAALMPAA